MKAPILKLRRFVKFFVQMKTLGIFFPHDFRSPVQRAMMLINSQKTLKKTHFNKQRTSDSRNYQLSNTHYGFDVEKNVWKLKKAGEKRAVLRRCGARCARRCRRKECGGWRCPSPLSFLLLFSFLSTTFPCLTYSVSLAMSCL